jgi:NtrC-family two-component system response regulator AlgB
MLVSPRSLAVLIVDDEKNIRMTLGLVLEQAGCTVTSVSDAAAAATAIERTPFDLAFVDLRLGHESGLDLIPRLLAQQPTLPIVLITAYAELDTAVEAVKRGAWDFLPKPFSPAQIRHVVDKAIERRELEWRVADLEQRVGAEEVDVETQSPRMRAALETVSRAAAADASVLLRGENGTGKGVLARLLHAGSTRRQQPFVVVNCPTLSEELLASELFGHARGAFTGAVRDQPGRVEAAQGGTLFLDEIAEIPAGLQAKLLRFLQDREFERLGETRTRHADVRIVAATNRDLEADVASGRFRQDLLYRLNVVEIQVPPLRERPEDILPLARRFLATLSRTTRTSPPTLSKAAEQALLAYDWPGNVRELRNTIERVLILWPAQVIEPQAFPERMVPRDHATPTLGGDHTLDEIEREHILRVVARTTTLDDAAKILGIDASTLYRKRKKYES